MTPEEALASPFCELSASPALNGTIAWVESLIRKEPTDG